MSPRDDVDIAGYHVSTPAIDIHTIGAAAAQLLESTTQAFCLWVQKEPAQTQGPRAGAGGTLPTVTDAHLVLGRLRPGKSAGGTLDLDLDAAREAIDIHVAQSLV